MKYSQVLFVALCVSLVLLGFGFKSGNWTLLWLSLIAGFVALIGYFLSFMNRRIKKMKPGITVLGFLFLCLVLNACMTPVRGDAFVTYKNESGLGTLNRIFSYTHENNHILRREMKSNRTYGYFIKNGYIEVIFEADIAPPSFTIYNNGVLTKTVDCIAKYDCGAELYPRDSLVVKMSQRKQ